MLTCKRCGLIFEGRERLWRCSCGGAFHLTGLKMSLSPSQRGIWRYLEGFFPSLDRGSLVSLGEGDTPLIEREVGGRKAWFKLDYLMPTGSYKDRGMSVLTTWLKTVGLSRVVEDSSGNAGSSMAAYCAADGIGVDVYVPEYTSAGK